MCDETLKSNILQGVRAYEDANNQNAGLSINPFRLKKRNMINMKR